MKSLIYFLFIFTLMATMAPTPAPAGDLTIPNTFQSDTPAVAAEVNANFTAVESAVDDNDSRIKALEDALATLQDTVASQANTITTLQTTVSTQAATIASLESDLDDVQSSQVMALDPYLSVDETTDSRGPLVQLAGVNLQIVNGLGSTDTKNGLGNLIIGYDEVNTDTHIQHCSSGMYSDQESCEDEGWIWSHSHKSGSHYLVTGSENNYSSYGGIVAGLRNFATQVYSTVTGGRQNTASGSYSSVSAGLSNTASGGMSSVCSGHSNTASAYSSSVSGGYHNAASGSHSSVSGGYYNTASGTYGSISGGANRSVSGNHDWRAGSLFEDD